MTVEGWPDWIETYLQYTSGIPSPEIFRLWAAIVGVAGALEQRVWIKSMGEKLFPTFYVLLVGEPGSGKSQAIRPISALWHATKDLHIASNSVTKASLTDELEQAKRIILIDNDVIEYHSLQIAASEFGVLVPAHDLDFLNFLNQIYDNDPTYKESRRTGGKKIETISPQINILAGTQPAYLATLLPEEAWGLGFMTRMILVHSGEEIKIVDPFAAGTKDPEILYSLVEKMKHLLQAYGECDWEDSAKNAAREWYNLGCPPVPDHSRLQSYNRRRFMHALRLCIVSAASAGHPTLITLSDFNRALDWLLQTEATIPNIFKDMVQRSDGQTITELHQYVWNIYAKTRAPVHEARLVFFLQNRVTSDKINRIIEIAVRSNVLDKLEGTSLYRPRPKNEHGVE